MDYQRRFGGLARLYGAAALARFARARVCVVGVGGVGSWAVEALARSGIGALTLIDLDHIAESNVNRQIQALEPDFGKAKVRALAERVAAINGTARVEPVEAFAEADSLPELLGAGADFVVDCIDSVRDKVALIVYCRQQGLPLISVGGAGGILDPTRVRVLDLSRAVQDPLLSRTRRLLRHEHDFPRDPKRPFKVPCVCSDEPRRLPAPAGADCATAGQAPPAGGLNCGGYGSVVTVTASFGLVAVAHVLGKLADAPG